jgi:two-component system, OmpR family, phosphate regulon response regulator PhoB
MPFPNDPGTNGRASTGMSDILVIDDDPVIGAILERVLSHEGHAVEVVQRLSVARAVLLSRDVDLVLLDLNLPDGSGLEFLRAIRQDMDLKTPVIVLSGMRQEDHIVRGLQLGADDYVSKPFSPLELVARVDRWTRV